MVKKQATLTRGLPITLNNAMKEIISLVIFAESLVVEGVRNNPAEFGSNVIFKELLQIHD